MGILGAKTGRMTSNLPEKIGSENLQFRSSCFFLVLFRASSCFRRAFSCKRNCRAKFSREKPEENRKSKWVHVTHSLLIEHRASEQRAALLFSTTTTAAARLLLARYRSEHNRSFSFCLEKLSVFYLRLSYSGGLRRVLVVCWLRLCWPTTTTSDISSSVTFPSYLHINQGKVTFTKKLASETFVIYLLYAPARNGILIEIVVL